MLYWRLCGLTNRPSPIVKYFSTEADVHGAQKILSNNGFRMQTAFVVSHKMPWCALLTAVKNYNKSLEKLQDVFFKTETETKSFIFVLEAHRDQDLEDYITANY